MEGLPEEFEFELEALRATYGNEAVQVEPANSAAGGSGSSSSSSPPVAVVSVPVAPRCEAEPEQFVAGRLVMAVGAGYPAEPPAVQLADAKGMGDARLAGIQSSLAAEAASMAGELQLGHLCETALDLLTAANQPEGDCAFCLEPLLGQADSNGRGGRSRLPVVRLACYHCYHTACFAPWWQWQQRRSAQREAQLWSEYKSMAPLKLEEEGIRREPLSWLGGGAASSGGSTSFGGAANGVAVAAAKEEEQEAEDEEDGSGGSKGPGDAYVLLCPACRADIVPSSLAHAWQQLQASTADSWSGGAQGGGSSRAALIGLPPEQRQALLTMQQRHAAVMRRQQACGGIVDATHSVSISDLQQAAAAAAAAEAAAAEAAALAAAQQAQQPVQQAQAGRGGGRRGRGGPHPPGGRGPPPGFPGRQQQTGRGDGGRHPPSGRGGGRGRGRAGGRTDGPAAGGAPLAAAEGALASRQLGDVPPQQHPRQHHQSQQQQQHGRGAGSRGGRGGRHGRGGSGHGRDGGRGRESAAGTASAAAVPPSN